jgi:hypothetical protein
MIAVASSRSPLTREENRETHRLLGSFFMLKPAILSADNDLILKSIVLPAFKGDWKPIMEMIHNGSFTSTLFMGKRRQMGEVLLGFAIAQQQKDLISILHKMLMSVPQAQSLVTTTEITNPVPCYPRDNPNYLNMIKRVGSAKAETSIEETSTKKTKFNGRSR